MKAACPSRSTFQPYTAEVMDFLGAIEYPAIAGKTVKNAKSWIEDGIAFFELTFTDETSFSYQCLPAPKTWARSFDPQGEVIETWE
jgi:hypothetical protein